MKFLPLVTKNLCRNRLRTALAGLAIMILVFVVALVWSVLDFLDNVTAEKSKDLKAIVTERWRVPSQMPFAYAASLSEGAARGPEDVRPQDAMTWQYYAGNLDPQSHTRENFLFAFALEPRTVLTMMDDLDNLPSQQAQELEQAVRRMEANPKGIIIGRERLAAINKRVGERFKLFSTAYKGVDLEFEIAGTFPDGRYNLTAVMNRDYLNRALDQYSQNHSKDQPLAERSLNLVWLRVPDMEAFERVAFQINTSPLYATPAVKCETASSGTASFLEAYRNLIWGMRWLLAPTILVTMSLVMANAIGITVRERKVEMAVLKVLGFRPGQIVVLLLAETLTVGMVAGLLSGVLTYLVINYVLGGFKFPVAVFPTFYIPARALVWGLGIGALTSLAGSLLPACSIPTVRASEVFAKVE